MSALRFAVPALALVVVSSLVSPLRAESSRAGLEPTVTRAALEELNLADDETDSLPFTVEFAVLKRGGEPPTVVAAFGTTVELFRLTGGRLEPVRSSRLRLDGTATAIEEVRLGAGRALRVTTANHGQATSDSYYRLAGKSLRLLAQFDNALASDLDADGSVEVLEMVPENEQPGNGDVLHYAVYRWNGSRFERAETVAAAAGDLAISGYGERNIAMLGDRR